MKNDVKYYSEELAFAFLEEYCEIFSNSDIKRVVYQERKRAISRLDEYYKYGFVSSKKQFARKKCATICGAYVKCEFLKSL